MSHEQRPALRVVLNGSFAYFTNFAANDEPQPGHTVTVRIPHMGTEHVYRAGDFLAETEIEEGIHLHLRGVDPGAGYFNEDENLFVDTPGLAPRSPGSHNGCKPVSPAFGRMYATLVFPRPDSISSGMVNPKPKDIHGPANIPPLLASIQVFDYYCLNNCPLTLSPHPWPLPYAHPPHDREFSLYVYATAEVGDATKEQPNGIPNDHGSRAFSAGMSLFQDALFYMTPPGSSTSTRTSEHELARQEIEHDDSLPHGVMRRTASKNGPKPPLSWLECLDLWERTLVMRTLGNILKHEHDIINPSILRETVAVNALQDIQPGCGVNGISGS